jgi:PadR family transcriptional regulator, regulatory protein PadR
VHRNPQLLLSVHTLRRKVWRSKTGRSSSVEILLTVSSGPRYGLAIIQHLETFTDLIVTEGTIYPILGRLTRDGLLDSYWVENEAPHPRKYYRLSRQGSKRLANMKSEWRTFAAKIERLMDAAAAAERDGRDFE